MLDEFSSQLVPRTGGTTMVIVSQKAEATGLKCSKSCMGIKTHEEMQQKCSPACQAFFKDLQLVPYGGKVQATSATDFWVRGIKESLSTSPQRGKLSTERSAGTASGGRETHIPRAA